MTNNNGNNKRYDEDGKMMECSIYTVKNFDEPEDKDFDAAYWERRRALNESFWAVYRRSRAFFGLKFEYLDLNPNHW